MTLQEYIARLNEVAFWKEFTFAQNNFRPGPGAEFELADNLVWFGAYAIAMQLKQRVEETEDARTERSWFENKVLGQATRQIRDTLRFLQEHEKIQIINGRGHSFDIRGAELTDITRVVIFLAGSALPEACSKTRYHVSRTAGFIHILAAQDYLGILEKLRVPDDIRCYFTYREGVAPKLGDTNEIDEADIMGAFLSKQALPDSRSREMLRGFIQDLEEFDLSQLLGNLYDHIHRSEQPFDYYRIMLEFARVPRGIWREIKLRFLLALEAVQRAQFTQPFRLAFPATSCAFMICPLDPQIPSTGPTGEEARITGLRNLTYAAVYDAKVSKGVGILISKDGDYIQIDWSLLDLPWRPDPEMDARLAKSNPFREAKEKKIDSFLFTAEPKENSQCSRALSITPDATWAGMWRVKLPNGQLSDMVNLIRAKDAALSLSQAFNRSRPERALPKASAA